MKKNLNPRTPWLITYVVINIIATVIMLDSGQLIGDVAGNPIFDNRSLIFAAFLVVSSYIFILGFAFNKISKIKVRDIKFENSKIDIGSKIGKLLIILQISFMAFNIVNGVNIAGSNTIKTENPLGMIWVFIPTDPLFIIYYGIYRNNKYFYPNLIIWIISNVLRGWSGIFLFIIFFEWCRAIERNKITVKRSLTVGSLVLILYPLLENIKWLFRASARTGLIFSEIIAGIRQGIEGQDIYKLVETSFNNIIGRIQVTSLVVEVMHMKDFLQLEFARGKFTPFWMEGLLGISLERIFYGQRSTPISIAFTNYAHFGWQYKLGDWNTNIGYVGWFFIAPYLIPVYIGYTLLLGVLSFYFIKKIGITESAKNMIWLAWLIFLMPPWLSEFVNFIYALFLFLMLKMYFSGMWFKNRKTIF